MVSVPDCWSPSFRPSSTTGCSACLRQRFSSPILVKSVTLAGAAAYASRYTRRVSFAAILLAILCYQAIGTAFECALYGDLYQAVQNFRMGIPGILVQWIGGYALLKALARI